MRIKDIVWDTVKVICHEDSSKNVTYHESTVSFDENKGVSIHQKNPNKHALYGWGEVLFIKPWLMTFKAYWWGSNKDNELEKKLVIIHCILNDCPRNKRDEEVMQMENAIPTFVLEETLSC